MDKFKLHLEEWKITKKPIHQIIEEYNQTNNEDILVDAFTDFLLNEISLPNEFNKIQTIRTLAHELTHVFIKTYISGDEKRLYTEEDVCDFTSRYSFDIVKIVLDYVFNNTDTDKLEKMYTL